MAEYHVENFGCRASQADGASIAAQLDRLGLRPAGNAAGADVLVLNTCSVTEEADRQARSYLRKARRARPDIRVVVTGCYAQRAPDEVAALPGVDRVVGNSHKALVADVAAGLVASLDGGQITGPDAGPDAGRASLPQKKPASIVPLQALLRSGSPLVDDSFAHAEMAFLLPGAVSLPGQHTRPNLKVQDGCGNRCSFCVIPQTRGGSRSVPPGRVLDSVRAFVDGGGQEMVLSGINLGRWGRDLVSSDGLEARREPERQREPEQLSEPERLEDLIEAILEQTELPRLRISSVEPMDWSDRLLALFRTHAGGPHPRLARHAHLPLQSGSDAVLRAMYRRYRPWHYAEKVEALHRAMPDAAIGADVMVGFPDETDARFEETCRFLESLPFTYLHLFPFSARPGTPAWTLHRQLPVPGEAVQERMAQLKAWSEARHLEHRTRMLGRPLSVVTLRESGPGPGAASSAGAGLENDTATTVTRAVSDNFISVEVASTLPPNRMLSVTAAALTRTGIAGRQSPNPALPR